MALYINPPGASGMIELVNLKTNKQTIGKSRGYATKKIHKEMQYVISGCILRKVWVFWGDCGLNYLRTEVNGGGKISEPRF